MPMSMTATVAVEKVLRFDELIFLVAGPFDKAAPGVAVSGRIGQCFGGRMANRDQLAEELLVVRRERLRWFKGGGAAVGLFENRLQGKALPCDRSSLGFGGQVN